MTHLIAGPEEIIVKIVYDAAENQKEQEQPYPATPPCRLSVHCCQEKHPMIKSHRYRIARTQLYIQVEIGDHPNGEPKRIPATMS
jgi:hypothetical protein